MTNQKKRNYKVEYTVEAIITNAEYYKENPWRVCNKVTWLRYEDFYREVEVEAINKDDAINEFFLLHKNGKIALNKGEKLILPCWGNSMTRNKEILSACRV